MTATLWENITKSWQYAAKTWEKNYRRACTELSEAEQDVEYWKNIAEAMTAQADRLNTERDEARKRVDEQASALIDRNAEIIDLKAANKSHREQHEAFFVNLANLLRLRGAMPEGGDIYDALKAYIARLENDLAFYASTTDGWSSPGSDTHKRIVTRLYPILKGYRLTFRSDVPRWDKWNECATVFPDDDPPPERGVKWDAPVTTRTVTGKTVTLNRGVTVGK